KRIPAMRRQHSGADTHAVAQQRSIQADTSFQRVREAIVACCQDCGHTREGAVGGIAHVEIALKGLVRDRSGLSERNAEVWVNDRVGVDDDDAIDILERLLRYRPG